MKNFLLIAFFAVSFTAISFSAISQPLHFIDGIELKTDALAYTRVVTPTVSTYAAPSPKLMTRAKALATEACSAIQFKYAQLLDVNIETVMNYSLFSVIEDWWHVRYRYGGTSRKGIDCSALTGMLFSSVFGLALPRTAREQYQATERVGREELQEGDLVFFNTRGGVSHVGMYLANDYFVHASTSEGVTISNLNDSYYARKYIGGGRVNNNEYYN